MSSAAAALRTNELFRHFELEVLGVHAGFAQNARYGVGKFGIQELAWRKIDAHAERVSVRVPAAMLLARGAQHPLAHRHDQPRVFGERNEFGGADEPAGGMIPAHERLHPRDPATGDIDLRLIVQHEFVIFDPAPQGVFHTAPFGRHGLHIGFEHGVLSAPVRLRKIQRRLGIIEEIVGRARIYWIVRDTNACGGEEFACAHMERLLKNLEETLRGLRNFAQMAHF